LRVAFEIAGEAPIAANPGECSLDDPAFGEHEETMQFIALDDGELQVPVLAMAATVFGPWYAASAKIHSMNGKKRRVRRSRTSSTPSRSCTAAE